MARPLSRGGAGDDAAVHRGRCRSCRSAAGGGRGRRSLREAGRGVARVRADAAELPAADVRAVAGDGGRGRTGGRAGGGRRAAGRRQALRRRSVAARPAVRGAHAGLPRLRGPHEALGGRGARRRQGEGAAALRGPAAGRRDEPGELPRDQSRGDGARDRHRRAEPRRRHGAAVQGPRQGPHLDDRRGRLRRGQEHRDRPRAT